MYSRNSLFIDNVQKGKKKNVNHSPNAAVVTFILIFIFVSLIATIIRQRIWNIIDIHLVTNNILDLHLREIIVPQISRKTIFENDMNVDKKWYFGIVLHGNTPIKSRAKQLSIADIKINIFKNFFG